MASLLVAVIVLAAGCSKAYDAYFTNPCEDALDIEIYLVAPDQIENSGAQPLTIPPLSSKFLQRAFTIGSNTVSLSGGRDPIRVNAQTLVNDTVVLPARYCEVGS